MQYGVLRAIGWLKVLLTLRHFRRNLGNAAALIFSWLVLLGIAIAGGIFLYAYCHGGGPLARDTAFMWAAWALTVIWVSAPLLQFDAQRNIDLSGLRQAPLSPTTFAAAVALDAVVSPLGMFVLPFVVVCIACFTVSAMDLPWVLLSMALLLAGVIGAGQAVYLFANQVISSRRFADISMVIGFLIFAGIQGFNIYFQSNHALEPPAWLAAALVVLKSVFSPLLNWLLPGLAARAAGAASAGDMVTAGTLYLLAGLQAWAFLWIGGIAGKKYYDGEIESGGSAKPAAPGKRFAGRFLGGASGVIRQRERLYLWRDPILRMLLLQTMVTMVYIGFVIVLMGMRNSGFSPSFSAMISPYVLMGMALLVCSMESGVLFNRFGYEGGNFTATLLSPVPRLSILRAKSSMYLAFLLPLNIAVIIILAVTLRAEPLHTLAAILVVAANTAIIDLIGVFVSIYYPFTYRRRGRRVRAVMAQPGCGYVFLFSLVWQASNLVMLPGSAAIILGTVLWGLPGLIGGAVLAGVIVWAAIHYGMPKAAEILEQREPELLAILNKVPE